MFAKGWNVSHCSRTFRRLANQFFETSDRTALPLISRVQSYVRCLLSDSCYKAEALEASLKENFGHYTRVFDHPSKAVSQHKIAVTATNISDASPFIFTNYNGGGVRSRQCGECGTV